MFDGLGLPGQVKTREIMTEFEWRKRRLGIRMKEEEERLAITDKEACSQPPRKA